LEFSAEALVTLDFVELALPQAESESNESNEIGSNEKAASDATNFFEIAVTSAVTLEVTPAVTPESLFVFVFAFLLVFIFLFLKVNIIIPLYLLVFF